MKTQLALLSLMVLAAGCSTFKPRPASRNVSMTQQPITPEVTPVPLRIDPEPTQPSRKVVIEKPESIWTPTIIRKIKVDAYVDENGTLHPPTYKYVIERPGGWNLDAVRSSSGYVPPQNEAGPQSMPGFAYTGTAVEKSSANVIQLFDLESGQVKVTGLINEGDEPLARSMCALGEVAVFDNRVGWVIVPQAVMDGVMQIDRSNLIPKTLPRSVKRPVTPVQQAPIQPQSVTTQSNSDAP